MVIILLAAYNGERFIARQIQSIINQTYTDWQLYIRDDASTDSTVQIIKSYQQIDNRIHIISDTLGNLKSIQNFSCLLEYVKNENCFIMFSDQDDFWLNNKIEFTLTEMIKAEKIYPGLPILIHTAFIYANDKLQPIESKKNYRALKIKNLSFNHLLAQNPVYGCTMMLNNSLVKLINKIPAAAENHDYWTALIAAAFGKIFYLDEPTILYRQHSMNISTNYDNSTTIKRFKRIFLNKKSLEDAAAKEKIAQKFKDIYYDKLNFKYKGILETFLKLYKQKRILDFYKNIINGVRRQTIAQTILFYTSIIFLKKTYHKPEKL